MSEKELNQLVKEYCTNVGSLLNSVAANDKDGRKLEFNEGIKRVVNLITAQTRAGRKLIFIGNGASAAISSHMSTDYWKSGGMRAVAFNDSSLLTCISNDCGYQYVFEEPIKMFADKDDILIAISSSGKSENILNGVSAAATKGCKVITLSGFGKDNPLRELGDYNFHVPSQSYGPVEVIHHFICYCILDLIIETKNG